MSGVDIIGDTHANADALKALLDKMGYVHFGGIYRHLQGRKLMSLGDMPNRGAQNKAVIDIFKDAASLVVQGNHEHNEIRIAQGRRKITPTRLEGRQTFLSEYPPKSKAYKDVIKWFKSLPLYHERDEFRIVHACWHDNAIDIVKPVLGRKKPKPRVQAAINILLKGPEIKVPKRLDCIGHDGRRKPSVRIYYWEAPDQLVERLIEKGEQFAAGLTAKEEEKIRKLHARFQYAASEKPLFIGHYNLPAAPRLVAPNVACLNFVGHTVAYRWNDGDTQLHPEQLVFV